MARAKLVDKDGRFLVPVVCDNAEGLPYEFLGLKRDQADGGGKLTIPTVRKSLIWGDYSLVGYENRVSIERKSHPDLYKTIGQERERFERELEALSKYDFAAVVIEAPWDTTVTTAPEYSQMEPWKVFRAIVAWTVRYRIPFIPAGPRRLAEITTFRLLERFLKEELSRAVQNEPPPAAGAGDGQPVPRKGRKRA